MTYFLLPIALFFFIVINIRRWLYQTGIFKSVKFSVPIIVVGNITVGGTGKTPLVIYLVELLRKRGYKPGVVSRGYGGTISDEPQAVMAESDSVQVGDEAMLIAKRVRCPIYIGADRVAAVNKMLSETDCDIVVSDDGLQHYTLDRDIEIIVVDGTRRFGNGFMLPAGPLRESKSRLKEATFIVINEKEKDLKLAIQTFEMRLKPEGIYHLFDSNKILKIGPNLSSLARIAEVDKIQQPVHAVAGIGNPKRFFNTLRALGLEIIEHPFPDHYPFKLNDVTFSDNFSVIMTEKDAMRCKNFSDKNLWYLKVSADIETDFIGKILAKKARNEYNA